MRRLMTAAVVAGFVLLMTAPAGAKGPIEVVTFPIEFTETNPCTGADHVVSGLLTLRIHEFELDDPARHHFNVQFFFDIETDDGFSGRGVGPDVDNGFGGFEDLENTGMFQSIANVNLSNDDHQRIKVHFHVHVNQIDGEPVAVVERISVRCTGKPA